MLVVARTAETANQSGMKLGVLYSKGVTHFYFFYIFPLDARALPLNLRPMRQRILGKASFLYFYFGGLPPRLVVYLTACRLTLENTACLIVVFISLRIRARKEKMSAHFPWRVSLEFLDFTTGARVIKLTCYYNEEITHRQR